VAFKEKEVTNEPQNTTIFNRPNRPYHIGPYNPKWAEQFLELRGELARILGDEAIRIEHMGSTSVPGLAAKPQIDILIEVKDLAHIPTYYDALRNSGYTPKGDYTMTGEEYLTKDSPDGVRIASVHMYPSGHPEVDFQIKFREYLNAHPDEIKDYADMKLSTYHQFPDDYNAYGEVKRPYLTALRERVNRWSRPL